MNALVLEDTPAGEIPTLAPIQVAGSPLVQSAVAAPNISNGREPIRFLVQLSQQAHGDLGVFTITGEKVFAKRGEWVRGPTVLRWELKNNSGQDVSSGIYIYFLRVNNGTIHEERTGKIILIR